MTPLAEAANRYGAVAVGLLLGTLARYGLMLTDGKTPTWRSLLADLLLLGMLGLLAVTASDWLNLTGNAKVLMGAMVAVSSDRLVRAARNKFEQWAAAKVDAALPPVPAPPPEAARRMIGGPLPAPKPELDQLLEQVDQPQA